MANQTEMILSSEAARVKIGLRLSRANIFIGQLSKEVSNLVLNEDTIAEASELLTIAREAKKTIESTHREIKKPYLDAGKACDSAKNDLLATIDAAMGTLPARYQNLLSDIEFRKAEAERAARLEKEIKSGIEANILEFSSRIAACQNREELVSVERLINLEKGRRTKYGDFADFAVERYNTCLLPILKDQKDKISELEELRNAVSASENPFEADELKIKLEEKENEVNYNRVAVQETALVAMDTQTTELQPILPDIKKTGSTILCEIIDEDTVLKKHRELLNIELRLSEAKKFASKLREEGKFDINGELKIDGLLFKIEKKYK